MILYRCRDGFCQYFLPSFSVFLDVFLKSFLKFTCFCWSEELNLLFFHLIVSVRFFAKINRGVSLYSYMLEELEVALFRGRLDETFGTTAIPDFPMDFALENRSSERSEIASSRCETSGEDDDVRYRLRERKCALGSRDRDPTSRFAKGIGS